MRYNNHSLHPARTGRVTPDPAPSPVHKTAEQALAELQQRAGHIQMRAARPTQDEAMQADFDSCGQPPRAQATQMPWTSALRKAWWE